MNTAEKHSLAATRRGFTLLELSIVLVIIGLIVGGVLVGRDLINSAELRAVTAQIEQTRTAVAAFKLKYNCLPGDCAQAVALGLGTSGSVGDNGNGNGVIGAVPVGGANSSESYNFWYHLSGAQMLDGAFPGYTGQSNPTLGVDYPQLKKTGSGLWIGLPGIRIGGAPAAFGNYIWLGTLATGMMIGSYTPYENYMIDSKLDDGLPSTGGIIVSAAWGIGWGPMSEYTDTVSSGGGYPYITGGDSSSNKCALNNTPPVYNIGNTGRNRQTLCSLEINARF